MEDNKDLKLIREWDPDGDEDRDALDECYDDMCGELLQYMHKLTKTDKFFVVVKNFGWMERNGYKEVTADTGKHLLSETLPDCDCSFKIFFDKKDRSIKIQNRHHDSPTGKEWYTIYSLARARKLAKGESFEH
jgi:hypothetical protein